MNRISGGVRGSVVALAALMLRAGAPLIVIHPTASRSAADSLGVPILVYQSIARHHAGQPAEQRRTEVSDSVFALQMHYLTDRGYHVIPLATLIDALERRATVPDRSVVLTFDDGWANQYRNAFPVLRQLGLTATFFVYTTPIGFDDRFMTWDQLSHLQTAGMTIGSHSWTNLMLTDAHKSLHYEVATSRDEIARHLGQPPAFFAYPFGAWDAQVVAAVRAAGYRAARGYAGGAWNGPADLYHLRSVPVTEDMHAFVRALDAASGSSTVAVIGQETRNPPR